MPKQIIGTGLSGLVGSRITELNPEIEFTDISLETGCNLLIPDTFESIFKDNPADIVLHLAAFTDTSAAWAQRGDKNALCYQLNVIGTQNILNLCQKYNKYLIHISTDYVFDGSKAEPYTEDDPLSAIDWYGATKAEAEKLVLNSALPSAIVRLAYPYRADYTPKSDVVRKIIAKLDAGETLSLFDDQITTPTFIDDIAAGLKVFFEKKSRGIYHLVASSSQSPYEMALAVADTFSLDRSKITPSKLADYLKTENARPFSKNAALSNHKVKALGIQMKTLQEGLNTMKKQLGL